MGPDCKAVACLRSVFGPTAGGRGMLMGRSVSPPFAMQPQFFLRRSGGAWLRGAVVVASPWIWGTRDLAWFRSATSAVAIPFGSSGPLYLRNPRHCLREQLRHTISTERHGSIQALATEPPPLVLVLGVAVPFATECPGRLTSRELGTPSPSIPYSPHPTS